MNTQHTKLQTILRALLCICVLSGAAVTMAAGSGDIAAAAQRLVQEENKKFSKYTNIYIKLITVSRKMCDQVFIRETSPKTSD